MKKSRLDNMLAGICVLACMAVGSLPAHAYVPEGPHLISLLTDKLGRADGIEVRQQLTIFDEERRTKRVDLTESVCYAFPRTFRSDIKTENIHRVYLDDGYRSLTVTDGRISKTEEDGIRYESYKDLLLYRTSLELHKRLSREGVLVSLTSLGHFQEKVLFVIGARFPDRSRPQVWIDKESSLPFCWMLPNQQGEILEIYYTHWRSFGGLWYPMRISFFHDDLLVREIRVSGVQLNPVFDEEKMSMEHLISTSMPAIEEEFFEQDLEEPDEFWDIQRTIEGFKKIYE
jgi:hypothetical protein